MEKSVKKVIVELENGNKLEFSGQVIVFAEDEMTNIEKAVSDGQGTKACGIVQCCPEFMAAATNSCLATLKEKARGLDTMVMMKHLESEASHIRELLDMIFE